MRTDSSSADATTSDGNRPAVRTCVMQKVVIVNGNSDVLNVLEPALDAGNYDVVFVESSAHAYSQIRRVQPDLVILCVHMDDAEGLNVLSMLQLDTQTRDIPVVTYAGTDDDAPEADEQESEPPMFTPRSTALMN